MENIGLLLLQPTPFCNIDCKYCYLPSRSVHRVMSDEVLQATFSKVFRSGRVGPHLSVIWHVGEPLAVPISFYEKAFELAASLKPAHTELKHGFQTNGTLLNDDWCRFIKRAKISVGVSIDGPRALHDANRVKRSGAGTFEETLRGIKLLQAHDITFNVITVVTRDTLNFPDELFEFYVENGIDHIAFNVEEIEGAHPTTSLAAPDVETLFTRFVGRLFRLAQKSGKIKSLREFDDAAIRGFYLRSGQVTNTQVVPFRIVSVDHAGNFSTFSPELLGMKDKRYGDFVLGNFLRDNFETVMATNKFQQLHAEISAGVEECRRTCSYFDVCRGGAPSNKLFENGTFASAQTIFCRLMRQLLMDVALDVIEEQVPARGDLQIAS